MTIEERIKEKTGISITDVGDNTYIIEETGSAYIVELSPDMYKKVVQLVDKLPENLSLSAKNIAGYIISSGLPIMKIDMPKLKAKKPALEDYGGLGAADI